MNRLWIFDIDGTLANNEERVSYLKGETKDWRSFFADQSKDKPYEAVLELLHVLLIRGDRCIIITGRDEEHRQETHKWVTQHLGSTFDDNDLVMRKHGDRRDDDSIKLELLAEWMEKNGQFKVMGIFEDRHRVIDAWRNAGFYVFECNQTRQEF
jgi:FMN phosphatase YigB (HAD superfamily)